MNNSPSQNPSYHQTIVHQRRLLALLQDISLVVNRSSSIREAYTHVLKLIGDFTQWPLAHVYLFNEEKGVLESRKIWFVANGLRFENFQKVTQTTRFKKGEGIPGKVWAEGKPVFILSLPDEERFFRRQEAIETGLGAYFAFPVFVKDGVTAVIEFFSQASTPPDPDIATLIEYTSTQLGTASMRLTADLKVKESEARLAEAQRTAHIGYWEWNIEQDNVTWSDEIFHIFGIEKGSFEGTFEDFLNRVHPDDIKFVQAKIQNAYENNHAYNFFHRIIRPDKIERVLHSRGRPVLDDNGNVVKMVGTVQDMTVQKEAELQLARTVRELTTLMEISQAIAASLELNVIYSRVLKLIRPLLNGQTILLFLRKGKDQLSVVSYDQIGNTNFNQLLISDKEGICGEVFQTGRSILRSGEKCQGTLSANLTEIMTYTPNSILATPIHIQHQVIGVFLLMHPKSNIFSPDAIRLLETVAASTAIAITNAKQYEILQRRVREKELLSTISSALTETLELDQLLQLIAESVNRVIAVAQWCTIHLLNQDTNQLKLAAQAGIRFLKNSYTLNVHEGVAAQVIGSGAVVNIFDMQKDPKRLPIDEKIKIRSLLVAPIESRRQRMGMISVQCNRPNAFTDEDERLLSILGVQAGMAIENAQLFASQRKARELAEARRERMRQMARRVVNAQEEERARLARELHDESGQSLTALKIGLDMMQMAMPDELASTKEQMNELITLTDQIMNSLRLISHNLRPPGLDIYGLDAALVGLCQDFSRHTHLDVTYTGKELPKLNKLKALSLYRFAQEAITNAAKHAQATTVTVTLKQESDMISLMVYDDGIGFEKPELEKKLPVEGAGFVGMLERLEMVQGQLKIESTIGEGSRLTAVVPYSENGE